MSKIRLCLLGAGRWGKRYIDTIAALDGVELTALASRNPDSAALAPLGCRIFPDWREAVAVPGIDGVIVATPPALHAQMALAAISAGRAVLVEKPLTLLLAEAEEIMAQSLQDGILAMVGHTHLFNPAFREFKRRLPALGGIRTIRSSAGNWGPFRSDVTPLWDWAPHDLAMCIDVMGHPPISVTAQSSVKRVDEGWGGQYRLALHFEDGVTADVQLGNTVRPKSRWMEIVGESGTLALDDVAGTLTLQRDGRETALPFPPERPLSVLIQEFAAALRQGRRTDSSLEMGRNIVKILSDIST